MIKGTQFISIWSEDNKNLVPFYRDIVGLNLFGDNPGFAVFANSDGAPVLGIGTHSEVHGPNTDSARHIVGFASTDIHVDFLRMKDAGVEFLEEPNVQGPVWVATFKDPEGNLLQLQQFTS